MIEVYDQSIKKLAILESAYNISYTLEYNKLGNAQFTLLINDPKNVFCQPFNIIKIFEKGRYIDTFRIMPRHTIKDASTNEIQYFCEHVLGTLLDTVIFGYLEMGGATIGTTTVINNLLARQAVRKWTLRSCVFDRRFQYSWENDTLLSAIFSVPRTFGEDYQFTWNTTVYPWTLSLIRPDHTVKSYIRYEYNMTGITKEEDGAAVCTRLYALGFGEGINQLTISNINPTRKPYLDADTQSKYGLIEKVWSDARYQIEENLFQAAKAKLEVIKNPKVKYTINTTEFFSISGINTERFEVGDIVSVNDVNIGRDIRLRLLKKSKDSLENDHITCNVEVGIYDIDESGLSNLYERAKILELNSQGATNIVQYNYHQNSDPTYAARLRFKIPTDAININKVELNFQLSPFQAYSKAIEGGGASLQTSSSGGGTASSTASGGGQTTSTEGAKYPSTTQEGKSYITTSSATIPVNTTHGAHQVQRGQAPIQGNTYIMSTGNNANTSSDGDPMHSHNLNSHVHYISLGGAWVEVTTFHEHTINIPPHKHDVTIEQHKHDVTIPSHNHTVDNHQHSFNIPAHTHTTTLPSHSHGIQYGIYEGGTANNFTIRVDGAVIPLTSTASDFNIVPYLKKNSAGKIDRGWHEITILPNNQCMIHAQVVSQVFINSLGGSQF